ncbi:MAG: amino acid ABC transporter ATP-binding protein, partial [Bacteroidia bacterium]|nr:amino acid ABC transporter ATP-binding protein [Bacteroidia bacterium]
LALLEKPDTGTIVINGTDITAKGADINRVREKMGLVAQGFNLFSHLDVMDNITLAPRYVRKQPIAEAEARAMELLALVGLEEKVHAMPAELSGGQQQRIAIARCLAMDPGIILFDEPTSALDPVMTREVLSIIRKLTDRGLTLIIVTHEMDFARETANRVFYLDEGIIYEEGTPADIFTNPVREKTRAFVRTLDTLRFTIASRSYDLVAMNARIDWFCRLHGLNSRHNYRIQLVTEELIQEIFQQCFNIVNPDMELIVEHFATNNEIALIIRYPYKYYNPFDLPEDDHDRLGMTLVAGMARSYDFEHTDGINILTIKL